MRIYIPMLLLLLLSCGGDATKERDPQVVKVVTATATEYTTRDFAALSIADDAVTLAFKVAGRVVDMPVAKGMLVERGEVLAELDPRDVELQVEASRAAYDEAVSRLDRGERLLAYGAIAEQEVEALRSSKTQAFSRYMNDLELLEDTRIVAPFSGIVERTYVDAFQRVASGEAVVRIVSPVSTTVAFTAPENLVTRLGDATTHFVVVFDAYPDVSFTAVIKSFARTSSDALGFPVSLRLIDVDNALYDISPGMTCIAKVTTSERTRTGVTLPLTAIYAPIGGQDYVWVVDAEDRVELRSVTLGSLTMRGEIVVLKGVNVGDMVVVAGVYRLSEGENVKVINEDKR